MRNNRIKWGILPATAATIMAVTSCSDATVLCKSADIPADGWAPADTVWFDWHVADTPNPHSPVPQGGSFAINLGVRFSTAYNWQSLPLSLVVELPDSTGLCLPSDRRWRIQLPMVDDEGNRYGEQWGSLYEMEYEVEHLRLQTPDTGHYRLGITPDTLVTGIYSITLEI